MVAQLQPARLGVFATPVDTFVRPDVGRSQQLAQALSDLSPRLQQLGGTFIDKVAERDAAEGRRLAAITEARDWRDAVKQGKVAPGASPWLRRAFDAERGVAFGRQLHTEFAQAYERWELRDSDDGNVEEFVQQFLSERLAGVQNPDVLAGAEEQIRILQNNAAQRHAAYTADRIERQANETAQVRVKQILDEEDLDRSQIFARLSPLLETFRATGLSPARLDEALFVAIMAKAEETGDTTWFDVFDMPRPDGTPPISRKPAFTQRILDGRDEIERRLDFAASRALREDAERRRENTVTVLEQLQNRFRETGRLTLSSEELFDIQARLGPEAAASLLRQFNSALEESGAGVQGMSSDTVVRVERAIAANDVRTIERLFREGEIPITEYARAYRQAQSGREDPSSVPAKFIVRNGKPYQLPKGVKPIPQDRIARLQDGLALFSEVADEAERKALEADIERQLAALEAEYGRGAGALAARIAKDANGDDLSIGGFAVP